MSGECIVSGSMDHTVRVWKIADSKHVQNAIKSAPYMEGSGAKPSVLAEVHYSTAVTKDLHANYVDCVMFVGNHVISKVGLYFLKNYCKKNISNFSLVKHR